MMVDSVLTDDQIMHLWNTRVGDPCESMPLVDADKTAFARAVELAVLQSPEVQKMRKDADLWRFFIGNYDEYGTVGFIDGAALKAAIDASMEKKA